MNEYRLSSNNSISKNSTGGKLLKWKVEDKFIKTSTIDSTAITGGKVYV